MNTYEILERAQKDPLTIDPRGLFYQRFVARSALFGAAHAAQEAGLAPNVGLTPGQKALAALGRSRVRPEKGA